MGLRIRTDDLMLSKVNQQKYFIMMELHLALKHRLKSNT